MTARDRVREQLKKLLEDIADVYLLDSIDQYVDQILAIPELAEGLELVKAHREGGLLRVVHKGKAKPRFSLPVEEIKE